MASSSSSSDLDAATEALIAQLMAEDMGESYDRHSTPIGASYHDYEEPLSSYERQCLDAENDPDEGGEVGWGPDIPDETNAAPALDESVGSTGPAGEGTWDSGDGNWDSRFVDDEGVQRSAISPQVNECSESEEDDDDDSDSDSDSSEEESSGSSDGITSPPLANAPPNSADEPRNNIPAPSTTSTEIPSPAPVPDNHITAPPPSTSPSTTPLSPTVHDRRELPTPQSAATKWTDGLDYSYSKNKANAVRAYDEFKQGIRDRHGNHRWTKHLEREFFDNYDDIDDEENVDEEDDDDDEDEEMDDEDMPFIRIPWPEAAHDEVRARLEDADVVEIRVGDEETLESILRDIELRAERRRKGKGVEGRVGCAGEEGREREQGAEFKAWW